MAALTIVLPTYNGARFLPAQIESILDQSRGDFALIAVDDGSTDGSAAIIDDYARRDPRVRRLPSTTNRGQRARLLQLVEEAATEFVAIADQDDVWDRERNARLLDAIGDRALAFGRSQLIDGSGAEIGSTVLQAKEVAPEEVGPLTALFRPLVSGHAAIMRRSWVDPGAFFGALPFDQALGLDAQFSGGLAYVDDAVVRHRIHGGNQMNGGVVPAAGRGRLVSRYRARASLAFLGAGRVALYQTLDQLSRSGALGRELRRDFRQLAEACWNTWFGAGGSARRLEDEFHRRLDRYASGPADIAFFGRQVRSLTRARLSPVNLRRAWAIYEDR